MFSSIIFCLLKSQDLNDREGLLTVMRPTASSQRGNFQKGLEMSPQRRLEQPFSEIKIEFGDLSDVGREAILENGGLVPVGDSKVDEIVE